MRTKIKSSKSSIILIDFNNQVWRNHHATERKMAPNSDGIHTGSILGLVKVLMHAINRSKEMHTLPKLVICEDRFATRKHNLYKKHQGAFKDFKGPQKYKGNRPKKDLEYNPVEICQEFMSCIPHTRIYCEGEEADDVMASYVYDNWDRKIIMYSTDRDMWQLLDQFPNLKIFLGPEGEEPTKEALEKKFGTTEFSKVVLHKIVTGDAGDNVKGVFRYQWKKSVEAFQNCNGTIEDYLHQLYKIFGKNNKYLMHLLQEHNIELLTLNTKLVTLRTDLDYEKEIIKEADFYKWKHLCHLFETPSLLRARLMDIF